MADVFDLAQAHEQRLRDLAVEAAITKANPQHAGTEICIRCHDPIPQERRRAVPKARTCLECQTALEHATGR